MTDAPKSETPAADLVQVAETSAEGDLIALLDAIGAGDSRGPEAASHPIHVEFGIRSLEDVLADAAQPDDAIDALAVLGRPEDTAIANGVDVAIDNAGPGGHGHLAIKIVFGDDDGGTPQDI